MTKSVNPRKRELASAPISAMARPSARGTGPVPHRRAPGEIIQAAARPSAVLAPEAGTSGGKYVYCIIESGDPLQLGAIGMGAAPADVYTVRCGKLAAVVSDTPPELLDATRENVLAHERVNQAVMHSHTLIPMSFGTVFSTREDIVELLRSTAKEFADVLEKMRNKIEMGLKVLWDRNQEVREIERDNEEIRRRMKEIAGPKGGTHFARMEYGRLVDAALVARADQHLVDIAKQLREVSSALRINKPIGEKMIINAAFLIERDREAAFDEKVKSIAQQLDKLTFKCTGPWPPYNFVNIRLKLEKP